MPNQTPEWTDERVAILKREWGNGTSVEVIGILLRVGKKTVRNKVHRLKLPHRDKGLHWSKDRAEKLTTLWNNGMSINAISVEMGISRGAVIGKSQRLGLKRRKPKIKIERFESRVPKALLPPPMKLEKTKADLRREFEQIWRNTCALQTGGVK